MKTLTLALLLAAPSALADTKISAMNNGGTAQAGDIAPIVRGGFNNYRITLGTAASVAASDPTKASVASVSGATAIGHVATFSDTSGTIQDGGVLGTAAAHPAGDFAASSVTATGASASRSLPDHFSDIYNAADYGVVCDGTQLVDGSITSGTSIYSSPSRVFTAADVGKVFDLEDTNLTVFLHTSISGLSGNNAVLAATYTGYTLAGTARATFYNIDNTAAIARANANITSSSLDAYGHNARGFLLNFQNGVCASKKIVQPRLSMYGCTGGVGACTLYEIAGNNDDFIQTENEPLLTGTGLNYGPTGTFNGRASDNRVPTHFGLKDINLDCNGLGQTKGRCYATYGNSLIIAGVVEMSNAHDDCVFTEMSDASAWSLSDRLSYEEGHIATLKTHTCGNHGWLDHGPKDLSLDTFIDAESKSTGFRNEISAGLYAGTIDSAGLIHGYAEADHTSIYLGAPANISMAYPDYANLEINSPGVSIQHINTTACGFGGVNCVTIDSGAYGVTLAGGDIEFYPGQANVIGLNILGQQANISGFTTSNITPGANVIGIKVGGSFNNVIGTQTHNLNQAGDICIDVAGSNNVISGTGFGCTTFLDPNTAGYGDGGLNVIDYTMYGGTNYVGAYPFNASDYLRLTETTGSVATYYTQTPDSRASKGVQEHSGTVPTVAFGPSDCGTSPAIAGNNIVGKITVGSGTNGGKCTITLATGGSYQNPVYFCTDNTQGTTLKAVATGSTLACTGTLTAGDALNYRLDGYY